MTKRCRAGYALILMTPSFEAVLDEFLRLDNPFVSNRRITACPVDLGGEGLLAGRRVRIHWTDANRDPWVFSEAFDPQGHAADNLVWGLGRMCARAGRCRCWSSGSSSLNFSGRRLCCR